uniref:Uncharacterized protein n=1 Tax=Oryza brachyantha TaxID=4533 RepID=J3M4K8_ORYBR
MATAHDGQRDVGVGGDDAKADDDGGGSARMRRDGGRRGKREGRGRPVKKLIAQIDLFDRANVIGTVVL